MLISNIRSLILSIVCCCSIFGYTLLSTISFIDNGLCFTSITDSFLILNRLEGHIRRIVGVQEIVRAMVHEDLVPMDMVHRSSGDHLANSINHIPQALVSTPTREVRTILSSFLKTLVKIIASTLLLGPVVVEPQRAPLGTKDLLTNSHHSMVPVVGSSLVNNSLLMAMGLPTHTSRMRCHLSRPTKHHHRSSSMGNKRLKLVISSKLTAQCTRRGKCQVVPMGLV